MEEDKKELARLEKVKTIFKDIHSGDDKKIVKGLKALRVHGDDDVIKPIVEVWKNGASQKVEGEIISFISDIKSTSSPEVIIEILQDSQFQPIHQPLLTTIWNSKVDYSDYLVDFVSIAAQSDLLMVLDCLTILENLAGPFAEHHLLDAQLILREYAEKENKSKVKDAKKIQLMKEIANTIQRFSDSEDAYLEV